jgi:hypothetical protein
MKEGMPSGEKLTNQAQGMYSMVMPETGHGENLQGINKPNELTARVEGKARTQFSKSSIENLLKDENLFIDVKRAAKQVAAGNETKNESSISKEKPAENNIKKPQESISDEELFAKEIREDEQSSHMKWSEHGEELRQAMLERFRKQKAEKEEKGRNAPEKPLKESVKPPPAEVSKPKADSSEENAKQESKYSKPLEDLIKRATNEDLKSALKKLNDKVKEMGPTDKLEDEFIMDEMSALKELIDKKQLSQEDANMANMLHENLFRTRLQNQERTLQEGDEGEDSYDLKIGEVFLDEKVQKELAVDNHNPNLNNLDGLKNLIDKLTDPTSGQITHLALVITDENGISLGKGRERFKISEESKKILYEWLVERIISIPDKTPDAQYNIGSYPLISNLDSLMDISRRRFNDDGETSRHLSELRHYRETMHNLNIALRVGEQYKDYVLTQLSSNGFDFINNKMVGVDGVIRLYEKAYSNKVKDKRQWLKGEDANGVDKEVRMVVDKQLENNELRDGERVLTSWEKDRAIRLGRILFAGSQRRGLYAAFGNLPADTASRFGSVPDEYVVRSIYNWKIFAPRFSGSKEASRRLMQHVFKHVRSLNENKYDQKIMGVNTDTMIENTFGGYDMQSHGWRSELLYLGNQLFYRIVKDEKGNEKKETIGTLEQILISKVDKYAKKDTIDSHTNEEIEEEMWGKPSLSEKKPNDNTPSEKENYSKDIDIRKYVLGQRFYFSSLVRNVNFSGDLKADIWKKRASLMPSTVVTLLPDDILKTPEEKKLWESMKYDVWRAEERRIRAETSGKLDKENGVLKESSEKEVGDEATKFERSKDEDKELRYEFVYGYCANKEEFKDPENKKIQLLKNIIDRVYDEKINVNGKEKNIAVSLADTDMSFNLIIDDAPTIAWKKKEGEYGGAGFETADFIRLLSSDQKKFEEGWQPMVDLVESPQTATAEAFVKAVEPIAAVLSREPAQKKIEPFIAGILDMYSTDPGIEFIPGRMAANRSVDLPTSEIERYFKKTYISWGAGKRKEFLIALLQSRAVGNDGFGKLRKETKSTQNWVIYTIFQLWIQIIGAEAAYEMFKTVLPEEIGKPLK